jgi:alanyl-tRNA synthetase
MLGNFSFGDYFKEGAIRLAWEYLTKELGLPAEKLFASVYTDDDEAYGLWQTVIGLPQERIYRLGEDENFWAMGDTGPCGPCSEILIDQGEHMACGPDCEIGVCDCDRYLEIWNLVFMQYDRDDSGSMTPLPKPSIDTGMGLERIAAVCQGVTSNFDTDLFSGLIHSTAYKAGVQYGRDQETDTALRVIADHSRAIAFMIADGILPSNEGRGYVLRRLVRRAYRFGRFIGLNEPFLHEVCEQMVGEMGEAYPELRKSNEFMAKVVHREEENFSKTLDKGLSLLEEELDQLAAKGERHVPGDVMFKLYDTFGFPVDIVRDVASKQGFEVDEAGFESYMQEQRQRSKASWSGSGERDLGAKFARFLEAGYQTEFVGYTDLQTSSRIVLLLDLTGSDIKQAQEGEEAYVITARTPFYGESGGQVGDQGQILSETGMAFVVDTLKPAAEFVVHHVQVHNGTLSREQEVNLSVDRTSRMDTARNHTCTHLLHAALRRVLGDHVKQSGSLVSADRFRFDFTHIHPLSPEELKQVEDLVNEAILDDIPVKTAIMDYEQALQKEALGLFAEKYEHDVRVVEVPGVSRELCGGTHLEATGQAGSFFVLSETGVAAGVRRIEAATGWNAVDEFRRQRDRLHEAAAALKTGPDNVVPRVQELQEQLRRLSREKEELEVRQASTGSDSLLDRTEEVSGIRVLATRLDLPESAGMKGLRNIMDQVRSGFGSGIVLLAAGSDSKAMLILHVSKDLHHTFTAPDLIKEVAKEVQGSGGGRPDLAQAGGNDPSGIERALARLKELIAQG